MQSTDPKTTRRKAVRPDKQLLQLTGQKAEGLREETCGDARNRSGLLKIGSSRHTEKADVEIRLNLEISSCNDHELRSEISKLRLKVKSSLLACVCE